MKLQAEISRFKMPSERNIQIVTRILSGVKQKHIAEEYQITPARVQQIALRTAAQLKRLGEIVELAKNTDNKVEPQPSDTGEQIDFDRLTVRSANALKANRITTYAQLSRINPLKLPNVGKKSASEIIEELQRFKDEQE